VAQNLEIISTTLSTYQNSARAICVEYQIVEYQISMCTAINTSTYQCGLCVSRISMSQISMTHDCGSPKYQCGTNYQSHEKLGTPAFICVPWLIHMCAMTHSYVCHDSFIYAFCVPWLIHMCAMTDSYVIPMRILVCLVQNWEFQKESQDSMPPYLQLAVDLSAVAQRQHLQGSFAKETYNFMDPTIQRHPIGGSNLRYNACGFRV